MLLWDRLNDIIYPRERKIVDFLHSLYNILFYKTAVPFLFGVFHITAIIVSLLAIIFAVRALSDVGERVFRKFLLALWVILLILEVYREVAFSLTLVNGEFVWNYAWYQFPFQLCGTPLYVIPIVVFAPEGKFRRACMSFLAVWSLFGGLTVMVYPAEIFVSQIGISIQSYFHHAMQVLIGVVIAVREARSRRLNFRFFMRGSYVFLTLFGIAMLMNIVAYRILSANDINDSFNMFFISPYYSCSLPILSEIQKIAPYPVFLLIYLLGFGLIAGVIFCLERVITYKFVKNEVR